MKTTTTLEREILSSHFNKNHKGYNQGRIISIIVFAKFPLWFDVNELW